MRRRDVSTQARMSRIAAAAALALLLAGCGPSAEDKYLDAVRAEAPGLDDITDEQLLASPRTTCNALERGMSLDELRAGSLKNAATISAGTVSDDTRQRIETLQRYSIVYFCDEYMEQL